MKKVRHTDKLEVEQDITKVILNVARKRILFLATVDMHIYYFHIPYMGILRDMGYEVEVAAAPVGFKEKIEREGFKVYPIPFSRNPLSVSNLKAFFMILHLMKKRKYIMAHMHTPVASFLGRIAAKIAGIPHIVYTVHGFHFHEYGSKLRNFIYYHLEKFAGKFTDVLITINIDDYKIACEKNLIPHGRVVYIKGVGVDTAKFSPGVAIRDDLAQGYMKEFGIKKNEFVIISIAELSREKNIIDIISAMGLLKKKGRNFKLIIVGDGRQRNELKEFVISKGLSRKVIFTGWRIDIPELLSISGVFVTCSVREGLPVSVMEAMTMRKPVVAYNIRGVRDLVVDGETGFLVPFGDVKALTEKILFLHEHPDVCKEMGEKGRERIEKEFSLNVIIEQMKNLYIEILED